MIVKHGFLLLEVMLGLCVTALLFSIMAFYITIITTVQQEACTRFELLSAARNATEKMIAHALSHQDIPHYSIDCSLTIADIKMNSTLYNTMPCIVKTITAEKRYNKSKRSTSLICLGSTHDKQ